MKNEIIRILMTRDGLSKSEAIELLNEVKAMILENPAEAEDIVLDELGLEMDYIFDLIL